MVAFQCSVVAQRLALRLKARMEISEMLLNYAWMHIHMRMHIHVHMRYMYTYVYMYMHVYMYIRKHGQSGSLALWEYKQAMTVPSPAAALRPQRRNDSYSLSGAVADGADGMSAAAGSGGGGEGGMHWWYAPTRRSTSWALRSWDNLHWSVQDSREMKGPTVKTVV